MGKYPKVTIVLILCFLPVISAAESTIKQLKNYLTDTQSLTANFIQISIDEKNNPGKKMSGEFYLQRPGKFRWDYKQPYRQEIVSNADKVWFYDVDLEQVTVKKIDNAIGATPALLLSGEEPLDKNYKLEEIGENDGKRWVRLTPKEEDSSFKAILIGVKDKKLDAMELSDNFGQVTRIYFSNIRRNIAIDASKFTFKPPVGADMFEEF
ncbi:MAG: outer membrane lipoprotein chaperone LolA [Methylococcales bacterium]